MYKTGKYTGNDKDKSDSRSEYKKPYSKQKSSRKKSYNPRYESTDKGSNDPAWYGASKELLRDSAQYRIHGQ